MRVLIFAILVWTTGPAVAWQAGYEGRLCTLTHDGSEASVRLTFDPALPEYSITVTIADGSWPASRLFAMEFLGERALRITTDRHRLGPDSRALSVTDRGFGNVLNGLEFNQTARAASGARSVSVSLAGAAPEVQAFRACISAPSV